MTVLERIKSLAKKRDVTIKELSEIIGLSENSIYKWKTAKPKADDLAKIADYFHVSVDYLLGREEKSEKTLDETMTAYGFSDSLKQSIKSTENYSGKPLTEENYKAMADLVNMYLQSIKAESKDK